MSCEKIYRNVYESQKISMNVIFNNLLNDEFVTNDYNEQSEKFAIKTYENDKNYLRENYEQIIDNKIKNDCFLISCAYSNDIENIKFFIDKLSININITNENGDNCLTIACWKNTNIDIIKFLIEDLKINIAHTDNYGHNCLLTACWNNANLNIVKYLIEDLKMDNGHKDKIGHNCLIYACLENGKLDVIKYLIEDLKMDIKYKNKYREDCLIFACWDNTNLDVIKYLIEKSKSKVLNKKIYAYECFLTACEKNTNVDILKYLIEKLKISVDIKCILRAEQTNPNKEVVKYLIDNITIIIDKNVLFFCEYKKFLILLTKNLPKLKQTFEQGISEYGILKIENMLHEIYNENMEFNKFSILIDYFNFNISIKNKNIIEITKNDSIRPLDILVNDYSQNTTILFNHNNISYFGHKNIVYHSIKFIKEIEEVANFKEIITLEGTLPKYAINVYIETCYKRKFNINRINPQDIIEFLKFIDQYPTNVLSIELLEHQIIDYFVKHNIKSNDTLKELCLRYRLKLLCLYIHNNKIMTDANI